MSKLITLRDANDEIVFKIRNARIDICNSHTVIDKKLETIRLIAEIESIDIRDNKVVIYYKPGFYLVVTSDNGQYSS